MHGGRPDFLSQLPFRIWLHLARFLDRISLLRLRCVSTKARAVADDDTLWKCLFHAQRTWTATSLPTTNPPSWRYLYSQQYLIDRAWRDGREKTTVIRGHTPSVYCIQFDDERFVSASRDKTIWFWDYLTRNRLRKLVVFHTVGNPDGL